MTSLATLEDIDELIVDPSSASSAPPKPSATRDEIQPGPRRATHRVSAFSAFCAPSDLPPTCAPAARVGDPWRSSREQGRRPTPHPPRWVSGRRWRAWARRGWLRCGKPWTGQVRGWQGQECCGLQRRCCCCTNGAWRVVFCRGVGRRHGWQVPTEDDQVTAHLPRDGERAMQPPHMSSSHASPRHIPPGSRCSSSGCSMFWGSSPPCRSSRRTPSVSWSVGDTPPLGRGGDGMRDVEMALTVAAHSGCQKGRRQIVVY